MKRHLITIALLIFAINSFAQNVGCTDANAINYDANVQENDGSCIYEPMVLDPTIIIEELPSIIEETSGLIYFNNSLWTHNDSGGEAAIYKLDENTGDVIQTIKITEGVNIDIEDISQDEDYIYVGDFGNNHGNRDDLIIYKIQKSDIPSSEDAFVNAEIINFSYNDQESFERKNRNNDYDCESMLSFGDHLYLFTKNWVSQETKCYKVSKNPGTYGVDIYGEFNVRGLLTAADYHVGKNAVILIGYENFIPFMWVIWNFSEDHFFSGHKKRVDFAHIQGAQTEGACFKDAQTINISCEDSFFPPRLYEIEIDQIISATSVSQEKYQAFHITLFPNPAENIVRVNIEGLKKAKFDLEIYNLRWQKVNQYSFDEHSFDSAVNIQIPTENLGNGIFFIRVKEGKNIGFQKLIIK
ncbi:MAG: T9SS type A sorting domain-containing protein [Bacteroidales bacterium]|nr:T9SS type A sorting domain-containing protein [Bacteroidales bacterium]